MSARSTASRLTPDAGTLTTVGAMSSDCRTVTGSSSGGVVEKRTLGEGQEAYPALRRDAYRKECGFLAFWGLDTRRWASGDESWCAFSDSSSDAA